MQVFQHPFEYYQGVAESIDAENRKASVYLQHGGALGTARERILKRVIRELTPPAFSIDPGFLYRSDSQSRQCDLIVFDGLYSTLRYRIEDLVVVSQEAARAVIEVKSMFDNKRFGEMIGVNESVQPFNCHVLGFAYDGAAFDTAVGYFRSRFRGSAASVPDLVAIHAKNVLFLRALMTECDAPFQLYCIQFPGSLKGLATAYFLQWYRQMLANKSMLDQRFISDWHQGVSSSPEVQSQVIDLQGATD